MNEQERIKAKKAKFLEYFKEVPIQSLASNYIAVNEDTICRWKANDQEFADCIDNLKAEWAKVNLKRVRSTEWKLERIMKNHFAQRNEHTGAEGESLQGLISINLNSNK